MWSPNAKVWSPKIKNVESKILHLICSLTAISPGNKDCQSACTLYAAMKNTTTRSFLRPPRAVNPPTFAQQS